MGETKIPNRNVKTQQYGTVTIAASDPDGIQTATLDPVVDPDKAELYLLGFSTDGADNLFVPRITLTDGSTVTATRLSTAAYATTVSFMVLERY